MGGALHSLRLLADHELATGTTTGGTSLARVSELGGDEDVLGAEGAIESTETVLTQSASFGLGGDFGKRRNRN